MFLCRMNWFFWDAFGRFSWRFDMDWLVRFVLNCCVSQCSLKDLDQESEAEEFQKRLNAADLWLDLLWWTDGYDLWKRCLLFFCYHHWLPLFRWKSRHVKHPYSGVRPGASEERRRSWRSSKTAVQGSCWSLLALACTCNLSLCGKHHMQGLQIDILAGIDMGWYVQKRKVCLFFFQFYFFRGDSWPYPNMHRLKH